MTYSVKQVMSILNCKKGTVEEFRRNLLNANLIKPNSSLKKEHIELLRSAIEMSTNSGLTLRHSMQDKINNVQPQDTKLDLKPKILIYIESKVEEVTEVTLTTHASDRNTYESFFLFELFRKSLEEIHPYLTSEVENYQMYTFSFDGDTYRLVDTGNNFVYLFCKQKLKADTLINIEFIQTFIKPDTLMDKLDQRIKLS